MARERIYLFDTTLRDGQQTPGIDFSVEDKISIANMLDAFGLDYVEGGYPGANPTDTRFFEKKRTGRASFVAFGMTKRAGISVSTDPGMSLLLQAKSDAICYVAKSWDYHVKVALGFTGNLASPKASAAVDEEAVRTLINARLDARKAKNWAESDRIREELAKMGIAIKDNKDGTTSWEVKR